MSITIKEITNITAFNEIEYVWDDLLSQVTHLSFFMSWKWLNLWWKSYAGENDTLIILLIEDDGVVIAIAPFYFQNNSTLRFIGTGELESDEVATEYLDILCSLNFADKINIMLAEYIDSHLFKIKSIVFNNYLPNSTIYKLVTIIKGNFWINTVKVGVRYRAKLPSSQMAFKEQCSKSLIKRLRRHRNNFESSLAGEFLPCLSLSDLNEALFVLDKLHTQRWQDKNKQGAFSSPKFRSFHNEFCEYAFDKEWLQLWSLKAKGRVIATIYAIEYNSTCYFYQSGIDTYFKPNISPGYLSHLLLIETCINNRIDYYDFMKGSSKGSYKSNLSNEQFPMYETILLKKSLLNTPQILKVHVKEIVRLIKRH